MTYTSRDGDCARETPIKHPKRSKRAKAPFHPQVKAASLHRANAIGEPRRPLFDAVAFRRGDGEDGGPGLRLANGGVERLAIEVEHRHGVDLVEHDGLRNLEDTGYFKGLSWPSGTDKIMTLAFSPEVKKSVGHTRFPTFSMMMRSEALEVEHVDGALDHGAFEVTCAARC